MNEHNMEEAKEAAYNYVRELAEVNGVGTTWHEKLQTDAIQINLVREATNELPVHFYGFPVIYRVIGDISLDW